MSSSQGGGASSAAEEELGVEGVRPSNGALESLVEVQLKDGRGEEEMALDGLIQCLKSFHQNRHGQSLPFKELLAPPPHSSFLTLGLAWGSILTRCDMVSTSCVKLCTRVLLTDST